MSAQHSHPHLTAVIDIGNSRIKWAVCTSAAMPGEMLQSGMVPTSNPEALATAHQYWSVIEKVVLCCVAGEKVVSQIDAVLKPLLPPTTCVTRFRSAEKCCGVLNAYEKPAQLGADRFAALIGAWHRLRTSCLVVCAGTATTIDILEEENSHVTFRGGSILPGLDLMRTSLAGNTANLPVARGTWQKHPRNTDDAIESGCINAQTGAILRHYLGLPKGTPCLITGGAGERILPYLDVPVQFVETLVLQGLQVFASSNK